MSKMDNLSYDVLQLCKHNNDGSFGTRKNRQRGLMAIAKELDELGYNLPSTRSLKPKHVHALVEQWHQKDLTDATIKNRLSWLRWWAAKVKKPVVPSDNKLLDLNNANDEPINRAQRLIQRKLSQIPCKYIKASLMMQEAFGLRREEAIKFIPNQAIQHNRIILKAGWTKGGRKREVFITTEKQVTALFYVQQVAQGGGLIPPELNYKQQLKQYEYHTAKAGFRNTHGLRHYYAQQRYKALTKMPCPLQGGKHWQQMTREEQVLDRAARQVISNELGHSRLRITDTYLGKAFQ